MPLGTRLARTLSALALATGVAACDPDDVDPVERARAPTSGSERAKPPPEERDRDEEGEGLIDDDTFGEEGLIDDDLSLEEKRAR